MSEKIENHSSMHLDFLVKYGEENHLSLRETIDHFNMGLIYKYTILFNTKIMIEYLSKPDDFIIEEIPQKLRGGIVRACKRRVLRILDYLR